MIKQDKINFIREWYNFKEYMCKKYKNTCKECPLYESSDSWHDENDKYEVDNCKYDFEDAFAEEIIELTENNLVYNK